MIYINFLSFKLFKILQDEQPIKLHAYSQFEILDPVLWIGPDTS